VVLTPIFWLFVAVLLTFVITRAITRYIRARSHADERGLIGDITIGGVHIHHQVFGILIMLGGGVTLIVVEPQALGLNVTAAVFGVGVGLTFDEFALWLHLDDVYWSAQGRQSVDAIFCVLAATGALIGGANLVSGEVGSGAWWSSVGALLVVLVLSVICMLKGKVVTGVVGVFISPIALIGAIRLAKPASWWSRRHYRSRPARLERSGVRFGARYTQRWNRLRDMVAGAHDRTAG
jgi:hypothetical protein